MKALNYIRVVLIEPTHAGNIGAAARAMANMGVSQLALIRPGDFPGPMAAARAAGAHRILENARVFDSLDPAISDCTLVFGTSARLRSIEWPTLEPRAAMQKAAAHGLTSTVGILFGRESRGLSNEELERCHHLVRIPVESDFSSLNLGAAVMIMLYELRRSVPGQENISPDPPNQPLASAADMQHYYAHLQRVLERIEFCDGQSTRSTRLHRKLTRLFNRAHPYHEEIQMLRGILTAIERKVVQANMENPKTG